MVCKIVLETTKATCDICLPHLSFATSLTLPTVLPLLSSSQVLASSFAMKAPKNLPELVKSSFAKALAAGDLTFFPTQVADIRVGSIPVSSFPQLAASNPMTRIFSFNYDSLSL